MRCPAIWKAAQAGRQQRAPTLAGKVGPWPKQLSGNQDSSLVKHGKVAKTKVIIFWLLVAGYWLLAAS